MAKRVIALVVCDGCGREDVPMTKWKIARATGRHRLADLCEDCEVPLLRILESATIPAPAGGRGRLPVASLDDIKAAKKAARGA